MRLSEGEVHLWALPLDEVPLRQAEPPMQDLAADERARAARMRCAQTRSTFVQTRVALRRLLGRYLDLPPDAVTLSSGAWGKPQLGAGMGKLQFNVSHSGQLALIALSQEAIGVDLEWLQADLDWRELLPLCCHPAEQADFQDAADAQGRVRLLRLWTAKEAYLKGRGEGLNLPLTAIRLSPGDGWQARIEAPWDAGQGWWLHALALPAGYLGCLATPFPSPLIRFQSLAELRGREKNACLLRSPPDGCNCVALRKNVGHLARQTPSFSPSAPCFARPTAPSRRPSIFSQPLTSSARVESPITQTYCHP